MTCRDCGASLIRFEQPGGFCLLCSRDANERLVRLLSLGHINSFGAVQRSEIGVRAVETFVDRS